MLRPVRLLSIIVCLHFILGSALFAQTSLQQSIAGSATAKATIAAGRLKLENDAIAASWKLSNGNLRLISLRDRIGEKDIPLPKELFVLIVRGGRPVQSSSMKVVGEPKIVQLESHPQASRFSERLGGQQITATLESADGETTVLWRAILRDGSNYLRQEVEIEAEDKDLPLAEVRLLDLVAPNAQVIVMGNVKGSPVVAGNLFFGFEHPLSGCTVTGARAVCGLYRELPIKAGQTAEYSSVIGVSHPGQLRRDFLRYVERERAHPYRTFLHYNSWYDLGYFNRYDEAGALQVINAFGAELNQKRGVTLDSFLFDDGWDDPKTLWSFNAGFPDGFTSVRDATAKYNSAPGVWLSPWGGYGKPKQERIAFGEKAGFETIDGGFALSGPKYYARFRDTCMEMIRKYDVNQFKFDGTGNADRAIPGSAFGSDFDAAIHLIGELRAEKPDLYVNLTTGTYPSPFWLQYADSIWRGGEDHDFTGVGTDRQRWITYRDADTYQGVVKAGPLYPLNSLMLHGIIYAKYAHNLSTDPHNDFSDEVRDYFGSGTQLQEMYITPSLLNTDNWDTLAEVAKWSRENAETLVDTHWVGGDPYLLEVYGWASWSPKKGILTLRNPSDKPQTITLDAARIFELPAHAPVSYSARSPWKKDAKSKSFSLIAGKPHSFRLKPFQVLTLEAIPNKK